VFKEFNVKPDAHLVQTPAAVQLEQPVPHATQTPKLNPNPAEQLVQARVTLLHVMQLDMQLEQVPTLFT